MFSTLLLYFLLTCYMRNVIVIRCLVQHQVNYGTLQLLEYCSYNTRDCTSQMPKMCYCGPKLSRIICKYVLITPLLAYIFVKRNIWKRGVVIAHFHPQGGTGKFIYKASILNNKQLLSNMIDCKVTQVPYTTRIVFPADSYIFCSNFPVILCIIAIASYIAIWM